MKTLITLSIALTLLAACTGKKSKNHSDAAPNITEAEDAAARAAADGSNIQGVYRAVYSTLNPHVNGTIPGHIAFKRVENKIFIYHRIFAASLGTPHPMNIYTGDRCPSVPQDDLNGDGFLDIKEAKAVLGEIIVPLDCDVTTQLSGKNCWIKPDNTGTHEYKQENIPFSTFYRDLKKEDHFPDDGVKKLAPDEGLSLVGRPVLVQGVSEDKVLPDTVASEGRWSRHSTLPITCGIFSQVTEVPGVDYDGRPGMEVSVEEGEDRPARRGEGEIWRDSGRIPRETTGNHGEEDE